MNIHFFVIPCGSFYNGILERSFMEMLDSMASPVHLNMKYHKDFKNPVVITSDLCGGTTNTCRNNKESHIKNNHPGEENEEG